MNANDIKIGTKFELEIPELNKSKNDQDSPSYVSQIVDIVDSKTISIVSPIIEGHVKFLSKGLNLVIYYLNDRQELLYFSGTVLGHRKNGALDLFDVSMTSELNKIQRRRFYRLDVALSCKYHIIDKGLISTDKPEFGELPKDKLKTAYTKNLSCSGACLVFDEFIDGGTVLDISVNLEDLATIRVLAQVIRAPGAPQNKKYEIGMHIIKIAPRDNDILTRFIFEKQRQILKNTMQSKLK